MKLKDFVLVVNPRDGFNYGKMERQEALKVLEDYRLEKSTTFKIEELKTGNMTDELISFREMEDRLI